MPANVKPISPEQLAAHVRQLQAVGDRLEAAGNPDWLPVAQAAALLETLRIGAAAVVHASPPVWIGIDLVTTSPPCAGFGGRRHA